MNSKSQQIKNIVAKIDISKIANYRQEYPKSKTLRQTINCFRRIQTSNNDQETFWLHNYFFVSLTTSKQK